MDMKIPKSINIFSIQYKVILEKDYFSNEDMPDMLLCGDCDLNNKIIRIRKSQPQIELQTLLHEIIHAACHEMGLYNDEHDEKFIDRLALSLADILTRNKFLKEN